MPLNACPTGRIEHARLACVTRKPDDTFDMSPRERTFEDLERDMSIADRKILLAHVDLMLRPPVWVYEDMEKAIACANRGKPESEILCGDGYTRTASELIERWELEDLLEAYARPLEHEAYREYSY